MNVKLSLKFLLGYAASLAAVVVSFARLASLRLPVWAVVGNVATSPAGAVFTAHSNRMVSRGAFAAAKIRLVRSVFSGLNLDCHIARCTTAFYPIVQGMITAFVVSRISFSGALERAIVMAFLQVSFVSANCLTACIASYFDMLVRARFLLAALPYCVMGISARLRAEMVFAQLEFIWPALNDLSALGTRNVDAITGGHKKRLLLVVDRVLVEGIRTLTRGMATITECTLAVNKYMPSTGVLYHSYRSAANGK